MVCFFINRSYVVGVAYACLVTVFHPDDGPCGAEPCSWTSHHGTYQNLVTSPIVTRMWKPKCSFGIDGEDEMLFQVECGFSSFQLLYSFKWSRK